MAATFAIAGDEEVAKRIKKVGEVCIEGNDCGQASAAVEVASAGGSSVESNYSKSCATCHNAGVAGAPKMGDVAAWEPRLAKGMEALYNSAINGMPPVMPAKGMCFSCSDDDLKALVDHMVGSVR
jgi:cytochrome c5